MEKTQYSYVASTSKQTSIEIQLFLNWTKKRLSIQKFTLGKKKTSIEILFFFSASRWKRLSILMFPVLANKHLSKFIFFLSASRWKRLSILMLPALANKHLSKFIFFF